MATVFKQIGNSEILAERQGKGKKGVQEETFKGSMGLRYGISTNISLLPITPMRHTCTHA